MTPITEDRNDLTTFIYILLRDYLTAGELEELMVTQIYVDPEKIDTIQYTNPHIHALAQHYMRKLTHALDPQAT